jgi:hypothetical protein
MPFQVVLDRSKQLLPVEFGDVLIKPRLGTTRDMFG